MKRLLFITMMLVALVAMGCEKKEAEKAKAEGTEATQEEGKEEAKAEEGAAEPEAAPTTGESAEGEKLAMVEVSKEGTKFDPPVKPEQIPAGAWYCDMGTVEYARMEKGDGKCPTCGMFLKEKKADGGAAAPEAKKDDHGHDHDHGEGGHDHAH